MISVRTSRSVDFVIADGCESTTTTQMVFVKGTSLRVVSRLHFYDAAKNVCVAYLIPVHEEMTGDLGQQSTLTLPAFIAERHFPKLGIDE